MAGAGQRSPQRDGASEHQTTLPGYTDQPAAGPEAAVSTPKIWSSVSIFIAETQFSRIVLSTWFIKKKKVTC